MASIWFRLYVRILVCPRCVHDISCRLTHGKRESASFGIDRNQSDTYEVTRANYLGWGRDPARRDLAYVDQALDAHWHAGERPVWHHARDGGVELGPDRKLADGTCPGILLQPLDG